MAVPESWYSEDAFWQLFASVLFSPERMARAAEEVDKIEHMLRIGRGARVLDLCCGTGRHSLELARRGHKVAVRSYSAAELASLLSQCGFAELQAYGSLDGIKYNQDAQRLVVIGRKQA